jgi:hypothetical protein
MAEYKDREHFIPLRKSDLVELLCADKNLSSSSREEFRQFCKLVTATLHFEYNHKLEELKTAYAPFDPDSDTRPLVPIGAEEKQKRLNELYRDFAWLLERANFKHLDRDNLEAGLATASAWGLRMRVDFSVFEHLAIFARGDVVQQRKYRRVTNLYREETTPVPIYQRLVLIIKLRPHKQIDRQVDTSRVYLKIFKDIPKVDVKMLLPTARVCMTYFDQGKIGLPFLSGLGAAVYTAGMQVLEIAQTALLSPSALWGLAAGGLGYGYKSYYGYQTTKQRYNLSLTQSLYYQNLDSNGGVLFRLLDEAEEQECREALLAYFCLWRFAPPQGWTAEQLDDYVELYLEQNANLKIDFEISDALAKLERMRILEKTGDLHRARPLAKSLEMLDWTWDNYFKYSNPDIELPPV